MRISASTVPTPSPIVGSPVNCTSAVSTTAVVRPGTSWKDQYRLVWAITASGGGAPYDVRSPVVCASPTSVTS